MASLKERSGNEEDFKLKKLASKNFNISRDRGDRVFN